MNPCQKCGQEKLYYEGEYLCYNCDRAKVNYYAKKAEEDTERKIQELKRTKANT